MINMIKAEHLKYKRTFSRNISFIGPLYVFIMTLIYGLTGGRFAVKYVFITSMNSWSIAFMSFIICIIASLTSRRERMGGDYRTLKSKYINLKKMWLSKIIVIGYYTFITSIVMIINFLIVRLLTGVNLFEVKILFISIFIIWITTLILIPIYLFVSENFGIPVSIVLSLIGVMSAVINSKGDLWYLSPWAINVRLMCPILKIHPNGCYLKKSSLLLNPSVIHFGIIISIVGFIILSFLTSLYFERKRG